jgi:very-short-patch-repair endonuclease
LEKYGIRFLRFTDGDILSNVEKVVKRIKCEIELLKKERAPVG